MRLTQLKPAAYNPRTISRTALVGLGRSLDRFGLVEPVVVNKRTGYTIVGGHQRVTSLLASGVKEGQVVVVDLPVREEKALNVALNNLTGEWDFDKLRVLLKDLNPDKSVREILGFTADQLDDLLHWGERMSQSPDAVGETPEERLKTFESNTIKQIVLYFATEEYIRILTRLKEIADGQAPPLETHSEVFLLLLGYYDEHHKRPASAA